MHAITPDGKTILLADGYGLTRVALPNKVKNDRKAMCSEEGVLSLDAKGDRAVIYDDLWVQTHLVQTADLSRVVSFARFVFDGAHLTADGRALLRITSNMVERHDLSTRETARVAMPPLTSKAPARSLGVAGVRRALLRPMVAVGADGTVAVLRGEGERVEVALGTVADDATFTVTAEHAVTVHGGGALRMKVRDGGLELIAHSPSTERAHVLFLARDGSAVATELPALGVPARDGSTWVTQTTPAEVSRCDADGAVLERWPIADEAHHGFGEVLAEGGRAWFVPHHRGCLVALPKNEVVSRKLPAKEDPVRRYYTPLLARYNRAGAAFDRSFSLGRTSFWNKGIAVSGTYTMTSGDGSLGANVVSAALYGELCDGDASALTPFQRGGTGAGGFTNVLLAPITEASVQRLLAVCDAHRIWLPYGLGWFADYYARTVSGESSVYGESDTPHPTPACTAMLLRAVCAHLADADAPPLSGRFDGARPPLGPDELIASLGRVVDDVPQMPARAFEAVAWMVAAALSPSDAARVLTWMALDGSARQHVNSGYVISRALAFVTSTDAALRRATVAAVRSHAKAPSNYGEDRRDALLAALQ